MLQKKSENAKIKNTTDDILSPENISCNTKNEVNYNMKNEKVQRFEEKKILGLSVNNILSEYYTRCRKKAKSEKVRNCANFLVFKVYDDEEHTKKLERANFCEHPLCLMCAWRLSLKRTRELEYAVDLLMEENPEGRFYFLTLTVKNWEIITKEKIRRLQKRGVEFIRKVLGVNSYYVSLEITIGQDGLYHPHLHALIYTTRFLNTTFDFIGMYRKEWAKIVKARGLDYQILTLFPLGYGTEASKNIHEVTKYILKPKMRISREMVINVSKSIENVKKGFSAGEIRNALKRAKETISEHDDDELERLSRFNWRIEFYKWLDNNYVLEIE